MTLRLSDELEFADADARGHESPAPGKRPRTAGISSPGRAPRPVAPGKRTLTSELRPPAPILQARMSRDALPPSTEIDASWSPGNSAALPSDLATNITQLSGVDVSDVRVHTQSGRPQSIGAEAFAEGNQIHLGTGAQAHLPHEAWHVVQQKQGRVSATRQHRASGAAVNDDPALEREADEMGARAASGDVPSVRPRVVAGGGQAIIQGKFTLESVKKPKKEDEEEDGGAIWIDEESGQQYRIVATSELSILFERIRDGFRVYARRSTLEPIDVDDEYAAARLSEEDYHEALDLPFLDDVEDDDQVAMDESSVSRDEDAGPQFEKVVGQDPLFVKPRDVAGKAAHKDRVAPAFTVHLAVAPRDGVDSDDGKYVPADLEIVFAFVSDERPPTRFQNPESDAPPTKRAKRKSKKKKGQRSHTAAFGLIRQALGGFKGRSLTALIRFLSRGIRDLLCEDETEQPARDLATLLAPKIVTGDGEEHIFVLEGLSETRMPLEFWNGLAAQGMRAYEIAHHKSAAASFADGAAKGHGESHALEHLRAAERDLGQKEPTGIEAIYATYKSTAVADALILLDVKFGLSLPVPQWCRAIRRWFELLHVAFPRVMEAIGENVKKTLFAKKLPPGVAKDHGGEIYGDLLDDDFDPPDYGKPRDIDDQSRGIGGMGATRLAAHVRLDPLRQDSGEMITEDHAPPTHFTMDELEIGLLQLGDAARPDTRFGSKQMSHTVAWTLIRASILSFSGQPLANLLGYLTHHIEELVSDLSPEPAGEAAKVATTLRAMVDEKLALADWHEHVANTVVEYLRLHQLGRSTTYNKKPGGRSEGHAMQVLRENELHLCAYDGLYDEPAEVIKWAQYLLDADMDPDLPWESIARAVLHWEEALFNAFPTIMGLAAKDIRGPMYARKIDRDGAKWETGDEPGQLPAELTNGKPIATIGDVVGFWLGGGGGGSPHIAEHIQAHAGSDVSGDNTELVALHTVGGKDGMYAAIARGLIGSTLR